MGASMDASILGEIVLVILNRQSKEFNSGDLSSDTVHRNVSELVGDDNISDLITSISQFRMENLKNYNIKKFC